MAGPWDHSKSSRSQQTLSFATTLLLGVYLTAMGVGLSFFVYVLWPDFVRGEGGNLAWAGSIRVFRTPEGFALSDEPRLILLVLLAAPSAAMSTRRHPSSRTSATARFG